MNKLLYIKNLNNNIKLMNLIIFLKNQLNKVLINNYGLILNEKKSTYNKECEIVI